MGVASRGQGGKTGNVEHGQVPQAGPPQGGPPGATRVGSGPASHLPRGRDLTLSPDPPPHHPPPNIQQPVMFAKQSWGFLQRAVLCTAHTCHPQASLVSCPQALALATPPHLWAVCAPTPTLQDAAARAHGPFPSVPASMEAGQGPGPPVCMCPGPGSPGLQDPPGRHVHQGCSTHRLGQSCLQGLFGQPSFLPT